MANGSVAAAAAGANGQAQAQVSAPPKGITPEVWAAMTPDARAQVSAAMAQARPIGKLTLKVTEKGGVSVYGLGRWPTTLYQSQWRALLAAKAEIEAFLTANAGKLSSGKADS